MFNARDPMYRDPVGAVEEGTPVHFKIRIPRDLKCSAARLCVINDSTKQTEILELFWCGMAGEFDEWWECHFIPEQFGLYFYYFEIKTYRGIRRIGRQRGSVGAIDNAGDKGSWQLTVYRKGFTTPDWLAGGIMYQIFPDRFFNSKTKKENVPADRHYHQNWDDEPQWRPDENGEVTNSDYFGGDLKGIEKKLPYLKKLGVTCIYLNPIFEAHSNHRYNTADYSKIDPSLGTEKDFKSLCSKAKKLGIRILLDGVFSHTGSDSIYFNQKGRYDSVGAFQSQSSPYYPWYSFHQWPDIYESWWGFNTLPNVKETNPSYDQYINGDGGIVQKWLALGASGWRLDVADELPDAFIDNLSASAKRQKDDALVLGEVWEDASNKTAYGVRRRYLLGGQLDSVMNYPFRDAILGFLTGMEAEDAMEIILSVLENYPPQVVRLLMNHIGTHDTERAITVLAGEPMRNRGREWQSEARMTKEQWKLGFKKMRLASLMQYTLPGVPCIYYGDEAGVEGYKDPFNRTGYPWGKENKELLNWYEKLGALRSDHPVFREGEFHPVAAGNGLLSYLRRCDEEELLVALNSWNQEQTLELPEGYQSAQTLLGKAVGGTAILEPYGCGVFCLRRNGEENEKK
ncbi:MAG: alpha-amylase family glycosyl hydrolase [Oscillospiraceae bacterium]|nr:alpha-amylase family glycosyl hydrolase [Oscillospiraceae bacterium]